MPREVSRRTSGPPELKGRVVRPDIVGKRGLDASIVEDRPDPAVKQHAVETDRYLKNFTPTEGGK